jgi:hypothetical protein
MSGDTVPLMRSVHQMSASAPLASAGRLLRAHTQLCITLKKIIFYVMDVNIKQIVGFHGKNEK